MLTADRVLAFETCAAKAHQVCADHRIEPHSVRAPRVGPARTTEVFRRAGITPPAEGRAAGRHVSVLVLQDRYGTAVHLGPWGCSVACAGRALVSEWPAPGLDPEVGHRLARVSRDAAEEVGFHGAARFEFLVGPAGGCRFLHSEGCAATSNWTALERVAGVDVVLELVRAASGHPMSICQGDIGCRGVAVECVVRLAPRLGVLEPARKAPPKRRWVDIAVLAPGSSAAAVTAWAPGRDQAVERLRRALQDLAGAGMLTESDGTRAVLDGRQFRRAARDCTVVRCAPVPSSEPRSGTAGE